MREPMIGPFSCRHGVGSSTTWSMVWIAPDHVVAVHELDGSDDVEISLVSGGVVRIDQVADAESYQQLIDVLTHPLVGGAAPGLVRTSASGVEVIRRG